MQELAEILSPFPGAIKSEMENQPPALPDSYFPPSDSHCKDSGDLAAVGMNASICQSQGFAFILIFPFSVSELTTLQVLLGGLIFPQPPKHEGLFQHYEHSACFEPLILSNRPSLERPTLITFPRAKPSWPGEGQPRPG